MTWKRGYDYVLLAALAVAGGAALAYAGGEFGLGISPDSMRYLSWGGPATRWRDPEGIGAHYPPLLPAMLAAMRLAGLGPLEAARWMNVAVLAGSIFLMGWAVYRYTASRWAALLAAGLLGTSRSVLGVCGMVWSEPPFIFFLLAMICLLAAYLDRRRPAALVGAALAAAAAFATRYAGVVCVAAGALAVLLPGEARRRRRLTDAVVFGVIACAPTGAWMLRNLLVQGTMTNRSAVFHPVTARHLRKAWHTIADWMPAGGGARLAALAVIVAVAVLLVRNARRAPGPLPPPAGLKMLPAILGIFSAIYPAFLAVSISFFDAGTPPEARILAPAFVTVLGLAVIAAWRRGRVDRLGPAGRTALIAGCVILAASSLHQGIGWVAGFRRDGAGYNGRLWRQCQVLAGVRRLPDGVTIYTNAPHAVRVNTGREARGVPRKFDPASLKPLATYESELAKLAGELRQGSAVLVYVWAHESVRKYLPSRAELLERLPLRPIETFPDGAIYAWPGQPAPVPGTH